MRCAMCARTSLRQKANVQVEEKEEGRRKKSTRKTEQENIKEKKISNDEENDDNGDRGSECRIKQQRVSK